MSSEIMLVFLMVGGFLLLAPVLALIALVRGEGLRRRVGELEVALRSAEARLAVLARRPAAPPTESPAEALEPAPPAPEAAVEPLRPTVEAPPPPVEVPRPVALPPSPPPAVRVRPPLPPSPPPRPAPASGPPAADFATSLGPKLLAAGSALAFVVSLGFFVRYAWERDLIGPQGRVLLGALIGAVLLATGLRLLGGRYRPLGQGLAAAGLAGLYVSAFGAHAFYDLIAREWAAGAMIALVVGSVLLAARLDARLLATLAWIGGYLAPVLLATGEDRAVALFAYLALLDAGALWLDHRRPWPETMPIAALGTMFLYTGWYGAHFSPERFEVAAAGVVLFTALFAVGMARKRRGPGMAAVLMLSTLALATLAHDADRPVWLLVLSLALAGTALAFVREMGAGVALLALLAAGLPLAAWGWAHYEPDAFGVAAVWVAAALLMFVLSDPLARPAEEEESAGDAAGALAVGLPLALAGMASMAMAWRTDRPRGLLLFLLAQAAIAVAARFRWRWAEALGLAGAGFSWALWVGAFFESGREADSLAMALPVAGLFLLSLAVRGLALGRPLVAADVFAHMAVAALTWTALFHALYDTRTGVLAAAALGLALAYLAAGLTGARLRPGDPLQVRAWLGLAAVYLTLAIPVQLGLNGITLAWALEGLLLLVLGLRFASPLTRAGGYAVLGLAVLRLLVRHLPLRHDEAFTPVFNAAFGTWLGVVALVAVASLLLRRGSDLGALDRLASVALAVGALILLFGLLSGETSAVFDQMARAARRAGDLAGVEQARLRGRLALSVLWTVFATGMLAAGLGLRNRPLFYAAYALFAVAAFKVVFVDLAMLHTVYRMLLFAALALLLLAGAYLNLRFRERLLPREAGP